MLTSHMFLFWHIHFSLFPRFTFIWPLCFLYKSTNTSWVERVSQLRWPDQLLRTVSSMHINPCRFFLPTAIRFRAAESWNQQSGKEPTHHCPHLAGNGSKRLRQIFFLSSPTPSWRSSRVQVRLGIRGSQRKWRKSSMAVLFISPPNTEERWTHAGWSVRGWLWYSSHPCRPVLYEAEPENNRGQTDINETKRPARSLQTHPHASSHVSRRHGET